MHGFVHDFMFIRPKALVEIIEHLSGMIKNSDNLLVIYQRICCFNFVFLVISILMVYVPYGKQVVRSCAKYASKIWKLLFQLKLR